MERTKAERPQHIQTMKRSNYTNTQRNHTFKKTFEEIITSTEKEKKAEKLIRNDGSNFYGKWHACD